MTIPTTSVSLSAIQSEFGGTNPVSLSAEYYRGGSYVPTGQATSSIDGTPIPTSSGAPIRIGMFRGLSKTPSVTWRRPTSPANAATDTGTTTAVDTSTFVTLNSSGTNTPAVFVYSGFSGSSSVSGVLHVSYVASGQLVDQPGGGLSSYTIEVSTNGGSTYSVVTSGGGTQNTELWSFSDLGFSTSVTSVPSNLRVRITLYGNNWGSSYSTMNLYDVVFVA